MNTVSNVCSDEMNATIDEKKTIGESSGRRMLREQPPGAGTVDARRLDDRRRDVLQAGEEDDDVEPERRPDRHDADREQGELRVAEPVGRRDAEDVRDRRG